MKQEGCVYLPYDVILVICVLSSVIRVHFLYYRYMLECNENSTYCSRNCLYQCQHSGCDSKCGIQCQRCNVSRILLLNVFYKMYICVKPCCNHTVKQTAVTHLCLTNLSNSWCFHVVTKHEQHYILTYFVPNILKI